MNVMTLGNMKAKIEFVARIGPDIHEMISIAAADEDKTLNAWVKDTLKQAVHSSSLTR